MWFRFRLPCQVFRLSGSQIQIRSPNQLRLQTRCLNPARLQYRSRRQFLALIRYLILNRVPIQIPSPSRERIRFQARARYLARCLFPAQYRLQFPYRESRQLLGRLIRAAVRFPCPARIPRLHRLILISLSPVSLGLPQAERGLT